MRVTIFIRCPTRFRVKGVSYFELVKLVIAFLCRSLLLPSLRVSLDILYPPYNHVDPLISLYSAYDAINL